MFLARPFMQRIIFPETNHCILGKLGFVSLVKFVIAVGCDFLYGVTIIPINAVAAIQFIRVHAKIIKCFSIDRYY
ncbi:MAG: hypothetical protein ABIE74_10105 [Pseudomonadota bacterium]